MNATQKTFRQVEHITRKIEVLTQMLAWLIVGRCIYCGWEFNDSGCSPERCSYVPEDYTNEYDRWKERHEAMGSW